MNEEHDQHRYHNHDDSMANKRITPLMIDFLRATKPWVRLISVVMFVMVGLICLAAVAMMFFSISQGSRGEGVGLMVGLFYLVMGVFYLALAFFLHEYASSIGDLVKGGGDIAMEMASEAQKSFWKYTGIVTLVVICLYVLLFLIGIAGAMSVFSRF